MFRKNNPEPKVGKKILEKIENNKEKIRQESFDFIRKQKRDLVKKLKNSDSNNEEVFENIRNIIINPYCSTKKDIIDLDIKNIDFKNKRHDYKLEDYFKEQERIKKIENPSIESRKIQNFSLKNFFVDDDVLEKHLKEFLIEKEVRKVLLCSDSAYCRNLPTYKTIIQTLEISGVEYVEFTNIQPELNRKLIFKLCNFANKNEVNSVIVFGSHSTIDVLQVALPKLLNPNILRLSLYRKKNISKDDFSFISIPTIIVPDIKINSKQSLDNKTLFKKLDYFGDNINLFHSIDNADIVLYCPKIMLELTRSKQLEMLHEIFFRLVFNYFDERTISTEREQIVKDIRTINWYTSYVDSRQRLNSYDAKIILDISAKTVDGSNFIIDPKLWTWFRLEASLSHLVNSKKCEGLALFLPSFFEYMCDDSEWFRTRLEDLGREIFESSTYYGAIFEFIKYIESYSLPTKLLHIKNIKRMDYKFLIYLIKKSSSTIASFSMTKKIIKNISVW